MSDTIPILYRWNGEAMVPFPRMMGLCDKQFVVGQKYQLQELFDRSIASHNQFFAIVQRTWENLPEEMAKSFHSPDLFRKWVLIRCGWHSKKVYAAKSKAEARRIAAFEETKAEFSDTDEDYRIVEVDERVVTVFRARSMKFTNMDKKTFQKCKDEALDYMANLIGVPTDVLVEESRRNVA